MAMNIRLDSQIESYCPGMSIGGNESAFIVNPCPQPQQIPTIRLGLKLLADSFQAKGNF